MKLNIRTLAKEIGRGFFCKALPALLITAGIAFNASTSNAIGLMQDDDQTEATAEADQDESTETKAKTKPKRAPIYDEAADANQQIAVALAKAKKENRRVLIQWGGNWCGWCHLLHDCFKSDRTVSRKLMYEYEVVLVDVGHADKNLELAEKYEADFAKQGLPFLTVLDCDGNVIANQETEALESKEEGVQAHNPEAVLEFLTSHEAKPLVAADVLKSGIEQARESRRLVFLHFGAPWCGWCHRLEDWMARPEVKEIMDTAFVDLKIDQDRMEGGVEMLKEFSKGENGGIPWFVIVDPATGEGIVNSTGPEGNCGFPFTDEEIAWFGKMLESADKLLSEEARTTLTDSLRANRERTEAEQAARAEAAKAAAEAKKNDEAKKDGDG